MSLAFTVSLLIGINFLKIEKGCSPILNSGNQNPSLHFRPLGMNGIFKTILVFTGNQHGNASQRSMLFYKVTTWCKNYHLFILRMKIHRWPNMFNLQYAKTNEWLAMKSLLRTKVLRWGNYFESLLKGLHSELISMTYICAKCIILFFLGDL